MAWAKWFLRDFAPYRHWQHHTVAEDLLGDHDENIPKVLYWIDVCWIEEYSHGLIVRLKELF